MSRLKKLFCNHFAIGMKVDRDAYKYTDRYAQMPKYQREYVI